MDKVSSRRISHCSKFSPPICLFWVPGFRGESRNLERGLRADPDSAAIAHPTETIKCKLQLQLVKPAHEPKQFSGPIDVVRQTIQTQGVSGMWKGVGASFIYRTCFAAMFGGTLSLPLLSTFHSPSPRHLVNSTPHGRRIIARTQSSGERLIKVGFELFNRWFKTWNGTRWEMSQGMGNFMAGGLASNMYWLTALRESLNPNSQHTGSHPDHSHSHSHGLNHDHQDK